VGESTVEEPWRRRVEELVDRLRRLIDVEAAIVFGSWARGGGGEWSDVDVLIISDSVSRLSALDRFLLAVEARPPRVDAFLYTFNEVEAMVRRMNPLALSALVEGIPIVVSERVEKLMREARRCFERRGRVWLRRC